MAVWFSRDMLHIKKEEEEDTVKQPLEQEDPFPSPDEGSMPELCMEVWEFISRCYKFSDR